MCGSKEKLWHAELWTIDERENDVLADWQAMSLSNKLFTLTLPLACRDLVAAGFETLGDLLHCFPTKYLAYGNALADGAHVHLDGRVLSASAHATSRLIFCELEALVSAPVLAPTHANDAHLNGSSSGGSLENGLGDSNSSGKPRRERGGPAGVGGSGQQQRQHVWGRGRGGRRRQGGHAQGVGQEGDERAVQRLGPGVQVQGVLPARQPRHAARPRAAPRRCINFVPQTCLRPQSQVVV